MIIGATVVLFSEGSSGLDTDGDGMSDVWQWKHSIQRGTGLSDNDGDGMTNGSESQFGTDPNAFTPQPTGQLNTGDFLLQWRSIKGVRYQVQTSANCAPNSWSDYAEPLEGNGDIQSKTIGKPDSLTLQLFARLTPLQPNDVDGDGLDAVEEGILGTSDLEVDSDGDLIPDATEFSAGLNPASNTSTDGDLIPDDWEIFKIGNLDSSGPEDSDNDGFTTLDEFTFDLNPRASDFANGTGFKTSTFTFDSGGQLRAVAGRLSESFEYDADGNLTNIQ